MEAQIENLLKFVGELIPKQCDGDVDQNMVGEEMKTTEQMVADAALRIEEILNKSRQTQSGVQLEVHILITNELPRITRPKPKP